MSMEDKTPRGDYRGRQNIRQVSKDIVDELVAQWPGTTVTVDLDGTDEEDAYLWISVNKPENRDRVALTALELVNAFGARMGFWIVPRVLNWTEGREESAHRLRLVRPDEQNDGRNVLHRG